MLNGHLHGLISRLLDEYQIRTRDCEGLAMSFSVLSRSAKAPEARDWLGCSLAAGPSNAVMSRAPQRCTCMAAVVVTAAVQKHTNHSWPNYHYIREDDVGKGTGRSSRNKRRSVTKHVPCMLTGRTRSVLQRPGWREPLRPLAPAMS